MGKTKAAGGTVSDRYPGAWLTLMMVLCAAYAARHWFIYDGFIDATRDEAIYLPAILRNSDPALYAKDFFVTHFQVASGLFLRVSSALLSLAGGDYRLFLLGSSTALLFIFTSGVFFLVRSLSGSSAAALLSGLLLIRPRSAMAGVGFPVYLGNYQPRIFIDALTPWFFLGFLKAESRSGFLLLGASLGFVSWFYPVYPLQLAAFFMLLAVFRKRVPGALFLGLGFTAFFAPYYSRDILHGAGAITPETARILAWRNGDMFYPQAGAIFTQFVNNFSLPLALALAGTAAISREVRAQWPVRVLLFSFYAVTALLAASFLSYIFSPLGQVLLQRSGRLYHFIFLITGAIGAAALFGEKGKTVHKALYACLITATFIITDPQALFNMPVQKNPHVVYEFPKAEFLAVAEKAGRLTPPDAIFLIPPDGYNNFSIYAKRGIVVSYKTLSSLGDPAIIKRWYDTYNSVRAAYASGDINELRAAAHEYSADYILVRNGSFAAADTPVIKTDEFTVYKADPR